MLITSRNINWLCGIDSTVHFSANNNLHILNWSSYFCAKSAKNLIYSLHLVKTYSAGQNLLTAVKPINDERLHVRINKVWILLTFLLCMCCYHKSGVSCKMQPSYLLLYLIWYTWRWFYFLKRNFRILTYNAPKSKNSVFHICMLWWMV